MTRTLIVSIFLLLISGCAEHQDEAASPSPAPSVSASPEVDLAAQILSEVASWQTVDEAWSRIHPDCEKALSGKNAIRAKKGLGLIFSAGGRESLSLSAYTATPSLAYTYPVKPTHLVYGKNKIPVCYLALTDQDWNLVVSVPTPAGEKAQEEYDLSDEEQKALAAQVTEGLTPEERELLVATLKNKGKIAAIRELRKIRTNSLRVNKLVIEALE